VGIKLQISRNNWLAIFGKRSNIPPANYVPPGANASQFRRQFSTWSAILVSSNGVSTKRPRHISPQTYVAQTSVHPARANYTMMNMDYSKTIFYQLSIIQRSQIYAVGGLRGGRWMIRTNPMIEPPSPDPPLLQQISVIQPAGFDL